MKDYFTDTDDGRMRVKHMFSVYFLGIYCYDNITKIQDLFNVFIRKIFRKTNESFSLNDESLQLRKDFLYLWFLTALFHDMGNLYEKAGNSDNSKYSFIIDRKCMMSSNNLGYPAAILGIPQKLRLSAKQYFWH